MKSIALALFIIVLHVETIAQSFQWARQSTGNQTQYVQDVAVDSQGNVYVVGSYEANLQLGTTSHTGNGGSQIWLAKYSSSGTLLWSVSASGGNDNRGKAISLDASNNVYITGHFSGTTTFKPGSSGSTLTALGSNGDMFIAKYSSSGGFSWVKQLGGSTAGTNGEARTIITNSSGEVFISGEFSGSVDFDPSSTSSLTRSATSGSGFIAKYSTNGSVIYANNFGGSSTSLVSVFDNVLDASGNLIITGKFSGSSVNFNPFPGTGTSFNSSSGSAFLAKYNSSGGYVWAKQIGGTSSFFGHGVSIIGSEIVVSTTNYTVALLQKYNSSGTLQGSVQSSGGVVEGFGITSDSNGGLFVTGYTGSASSNFGNGKATNATTYGGILVWKLNSSLSTQWVTKAEVSTGSGDTYGHALKHNNNSLYIVGNFNGSTDFDPCAASTTLTSNSLDGFVVSFGAQDAFALSGISGSGIVCNSNVTYTISNAPAGTSYNWSISSNILYVSGQGTSSYVVRRSSSGAGQINVTVSNGCSSKVLSKNVWVGGYSSSHYPVSGSTYACPSQFVTFSIPNLEHATSINWIWPSTWTYDSGQGTTQLALYTADQYNYTYNNIVGARVGNACDAGGSYAYHDVYIYSCGYFMVAYPNPASDELMVEFTKDSIANVVPSSEPFTLDQEMELSLYDSQNEIVFSTKTEKSKIKIPLKDQPNGQYFLRVLHREGLIERQIIVKK